MRLTQAGELRKDETERLVLRLGGDSARWKLAMTLARAMGLVRVVGGRLHGFPGGRDRELSDPIVLLDGAEALAAEALLRILGRQWVDLSSLAEVLTRRCPEVLDGADREQSHRDLCDAAASLHRLGNIEAIWGSEGVLAARLKRGDVDVPRGIVVTSDGEILVVPGALSTRDFGRLCRLARFEGCGVPSPTVS